MAQTISGKLDNTEEKAGLQSKEVTVTQKDVKTLLDAQIGGYRCIKGFRNNRF